MMTETLILRKATSDDCESLFHWRNDETVRKFSSNSNLIEWETHQHWFTGCLNNPNRTILIAEIQGHSVGVLRYDIDKRMAVVSIYLVPGNEKKGYGTLILKTGNDWLKKNYPTVKKIEAKILEENIASQKAFERAGYQKESVTMYCMDLAGGLTQ